MSSSRSLTTTAHRSRVAIDPDTAWERTIASGPQAWHVDAAPLVLRGLLDRAVGGEGRRVPPYGAAPLEDGDRPGIWRVERARAVHEDADGVTRELLLTAEVRAPGEVTLLARIAPAEGGSEVTTSVRLRPRGVLGRAYLVVDLPAREALTALVHRRLIAAVAPG